MYGGKFGPATTPMLWAGLRRTLRAFAREDRAVAAVEFAIILPFMLLLYIGTVDGTRNVMSSRKVDIMSRTISDLVSQQSTMTPVPSQKISDIFAASSAIMQPFSTDPLTMTVTAVTIQAKSNGQCCDAKVNWSYKQKGTSDTGPETLRTCGNTLIQVSDGTQPSPTTIPSSIITANTQAGYTYSATNVTYLIIADVRYTYQPFFSQALAWITGPFQKTTYMVPRSSSGMVSIQKPVTAAQANQTGCST